MSNLTQQIAGAYIGAQVEWQGNRTAKVIDVIDTKYLADCRLILTPISAISDEDAVVVAKIINAHHPHSECLKFDYSLVKLGYQVEANYSSSLFNYDVTDYLRSDKRPDGTPKPVYDLGYMGIRSLIDAGIAISSLDKTETK